MPNPQTPVVAVTKRYYPTLSTIVNKDDIPEILGFLKDGITNLLSKVHYKDLQYNKSPKGDAAFYSLSIVSPKKLAIELPGTGIALVLNPDVTGGDYNISSFPITIEYQWKVLGYLRAFNTANYSFSPQELFEMAMLILNISEEQAIANFINRFVQPIDENTTAIQQFVNDMNDELSLNLPLPSDDTTLTEVIQQLYAQQGGQYCSLTAFGVYLLDNDVEVTLSNVKIYFKSFIPDDLDEFIKDVLIPKFRATLTLIAGVEFPRSLLKPVYDENGLSPYSSSTGTALDVIPDDGTGNPKVLFTFGEALFYADTEVGFGYNMELILNTFVPAQIGNTGLIINIENLKLDLSKENNIAEAEADGRPDDFMGFYTDEVEIFLPKKWFVSDSQAPQTLKILGRRLLVGTGGISGVIGLEAVELENSNSTNDTLWFNIGNSSGFRVGFNKFDITFKQNVVTESNIAAKLEIPKLKKENGQDFSIDIVGHLDHEGDFNLTASANGGLIHARLGNYVDFNFLSLELGKESGDFYIGTSVEMTFPSGIINEILGDQKIVIPTMRFYSNGKFEIVGGTGFIPVNITLPLGPVNIAVTGIHMGSIQREHHGVMRKYNYVGFDGAISINPLGVDARGEGIKYYYTTDDDEHSGQGDHYLHIQTIEIDLVIPANTKTVSLHGLLSIPEPGASQEYYGEIDLKIPSLKVSGRAAMRLAPKFPAFIVDAEIDLPAPITIGSFAIYGFRGLIGYRYVAEKAAIKALPPDATWYEYYKYPPKGVHVTKFSGPYDTTKYNNPFSLGVGAVLGTGFDNGTVISLRAMILLSIPSLFMIEARASIISARLGLTDSKEPPFWAMVAWGENSIETGMGADFKMPTSTGKVFTLQANAESYFPIKGSTKSWYLNIGTREKPNTAILFPDAINLRSLTYLMINSQGIEFGSRVDYELNKKFFGIKVKIWAFVEVGARISFERPQFGGYIHLGGGIDVNVWRIIYVNFVLDAYLSGEAVKPYLIYAKLEFRGRIRIARFFKLRFKLTLEIKWEKNREVETAPIPILTGSSLSTNEQQVKGVHMLTNEEFYIKYFNTAPDANDIDNVIPLDTYIDIKFVKPVVPNSVSDIIGGHTSGAEGFIDLIPPEKTVRGGHVLRQVKHKYIIENFQIKASNGGGWVDYHPFKAMYPDDITAQNRKIGYWQRAGNQYDTIRVLGGDPFSYVQQGEPGWFIPEHYGITASNIFCADSQDIWHTSNVLNKNLNHLYQYAVVQQNMHFIRGAYFGVLGELAAEPNLSTQVPYNQMKVTNLPNVFNYQKSLTFNNANGLEIILPEDAPMLNLKLSSSVAVEIKFYKTQISPNSSFVDYVLEHSVIMTPIELQNVLNFEFLNKPIIKIEIIPQVPNYQLIAQIQEQMEELMSDSYESNDGTIMVTLPSDTMAYNALLLQLEDLLSNTCLQVGAGNCSNEGQIWCSFYNELASLGCFGQTIYSLEDFQLGCYELFTNTIKNYQTIYNFIYQDDILMTYYGNYNEILSYIINQVNYHQNFENAIKAYEVFLNLVVQILTHILEMSGCDCNATINSCLTSFHEIKWKNISDYEYELTIPSQQAQEAENNALIESVLNTIQPIWRPNTKYYVSFTLRDLVNDIPKPPQEHFYGFKTTGPIGHFHNADDVKYGNEYDKYGNILNRKDNNEVFSEEGKLTNPDKYSLTSLRKYLDYKRSYPNVDGNLIKAKPIYYANGECKITLNFVKPLAFSMFKTWENYNGLGKIKGALNIQIKDPVTDEVLSYPLDINHITNEIIPQTSPNGQNTEEWIDDNDPRIPVNIQILQNLIQNGNLPCGFSLGQPLIPRSYTYSVEVTDLKPRKLYTALINNAFDVNGDQNFSSYLDTSRNIGVDENNEVHKFVFQTSRYANFEEHIDSYILDSENNKKAIFTLSHDFSITMLNEAYVIVSNPDSNTDTGQLGYADLLDNVLEGIFKFKPFESATTTEFNILKNTENQTVGLFIRSCEPFNNPDLDELELKNSIKIISGDPSDFKVLYSKDYASCLVMKNGIIINDNSLEIEFLYKFWNGTQLDEVSKVITIEL